MTARLKAQAHEILRLQVELDQKIDYGDAEDCRARLEAFCEALRAPDSEG